MKAFAKPADREGNPHLLSLNLLNISSRGAAARIKAMKLSWKHGRKQWGGRDMIRTMWKKLLFSQDTSEDDFKEQYGSTTQEASTLATACDEDHCESGISKRESFSD
jgi:hypothetical protein